MKKIPALSFLFLSIFASNVLGQLTVEHCQEKAKLNYPQIKQFELIEKSADYNLSNANKANLPQISFSAKATYQSEVTSIPSAFIPNVPTLSKDQYQAVLEVGQTLWDGGTTASQQKIIRANAEVEKQKLEVDLYAIKDRVNQLFFGLLLIKEQLLQNATLQNELQTNYEKVEVYIQNGVANQADLDAVKLELLSNSQRRTELMSAQKSFCEMLSAMTGEVLTETTSLEKPVIVVTDGLESNLNRPELRLFDSQLNVIDNQSELVEAGNLPKVGVFLQGGLGKPGLNFLKNEFSPFYIGGVRLSWNISGLLYTQKNNLNSLKLNKELVFTQKETFLFNTNLKIAQQNNEIEKIKELIRSDDEIIRLHTNIKNSSAVKVENGVKTVTDLLREINAESLSKQQKSLHEIQLLMDIYNLKYSTNK